jgi:hypothetical protein
MKITDSGISGMHLFDEFSSIIKQFNSHGVIYVVIGGIAMAFHDEPRFTKDMDFLILPEEREKIRQILEELDYFESAEPWTFRNSQLTLNRFMKIEGEDHLIADILYSPETKFREIIEKAIIQDSSYGSVRIASRNDLIWLKQRRGSDQDQVDIRKLQSDKN